MFSGSYKERVRVKFVKYRQNNGFLLSGMFIALFVARDSMNSILMWVANKLISNHKGVPKEVVFLESRQQGYGDLLFQTPIFEAISNSDYKIDVVILKKHLPIVEGNPHIRKVYFWNNYFNTLILPFRKKGYVVFLGRNTITETIFGLMFYKSEKIILDKNLKIWKKLFSQNHTIAWQELIKDYLDKDLQFGKPKIYSGISDQNSQISDRKKVAVIVGVDKKEKRYEGMVQLIKLLGQHHNLELYLVGACDKTTEQSFRDYHNDPYKNLLNNQSYSDAIKLISSMDAVIGTEGSLIHISTTLGIPTVVIEGKNQFWNYSNLEKTDDISIVPSSSTPEKIIQSLNLLID